MGIWACGSVFWVTSSRDSGLNRAVLGVILLVQGAQERLQGRAVVTHKGTRKRPRAVMFPAGPGAGHSREGSRSQQSREQSREEKRSQRSPERGTTGEQGSMLKESPGKTA